MRTAALAHFVIIALALGGPAWAQDLPAPDLSPPEVRPAPVPAPAVEPDLSAPRILSVPDKPTSSITQQPVEQTAPVARQPPEPAPKVQDRADTKGDLLPPPPAAGSRFSFKRVHGGLIRLDGETGQTAHCASRSDGWSCRTVPEDSAPLEKQLTQFSGDVSGLKGDVSRLEGEVTGLQGEVTGLKGEVSGLKNEVSALNEQIAALTKEVQALRPPPPPVPPAQVTPQDKPEADTLQMPTREDLAKARDYVRDKVQATWRRLVEMIGDVQKNVLGES